MKVQGSLKRGILYSIMVVVLCICTRVWISFYHPGCVCVCVCCHRFEKEEGRGCDHCDGEIMSAIMNEFLPLHF